MSRFCAALAVQATGQRQALRDPIKYTSVRSDSVALVAECARVYRVGATFAISTVVAEFMHKDTDGMLGENAIESAKRQLSGELFGEYEAPLREAIHLLHSGDSPAARRLIERVLNNLHSPEPFDPR